MVGLEMAFSLLRRSRLALSCLACAELRARLVQAGFERVKQFSYVRAAQELLALLEEAAV